ncbi:MAG: cupin domain-containing protein [Phycisphaerae bacterium]|jgi:quercetin dioxygenase-like cupin family protein
MSAHGETSFSGRPFVIPLPDSGAYVPLLNPPQGVPAMRSGLVTLAPGAECGQHTTGSHEEMIICLSGAGEIDVEGMGTARLSAGQAAYNPPNTRHNVRNTGSEPLRYVFVVAPRVCVATRDGS